jgi:hypothetical protein
VLRPVLAIKTTKELEDFYITFLKAAISKCLDFNVAITSSDVRKSDAFFYVSGLRGICEDLIALRYLSSVDPAIRADYLKTLLAMNLAQGISVQHKFFKANNPLQPLIGAPFPIGNQDKGAIEAQIDENLKSAKQKFENAAR